MDTVNIFISKTTISKDDAATSNQIKYLRALCLDRNIEFPFQSLQESKKHLKKYEASKAINELVENGNAIVFIYPKD